MLYRYSGIIVYKPKITILLCQKSMYSTMRGLILYLKAATKVNIEIDLLARYTERLGEFKDKSE